LSRIYNQQNSESDRNKNGGIMSEQLPALRAEELYSPITLELGKQDITEAMKLYRDFIDLPHHIKSQLHHVDEARPRTGMSGYMHKGENAPGGSKKQDNKHAFHYAQSLEQLSLRELDLPPEAMNFLSAAEEIYYSLDESVREHLAQLAEMEGIPWLVGLHHPTTNGERSHHLRFLAYEDPKGSNLADSHYDKSTFTVAVAESHNGLRIGNNDHDLQLLERGSFDPILFQGYGWHQLKDMFDIHSDLKPGWHDVIDTGERVDSGVTRWALIYFVNPTELYLESTQEQTHTPLYPALGRAALTAA
jgi:hypothetical protein